ncbi:MAG: C4-dicarboxylate transporter DcuC [Desulfovibrio sp.]|jgi:DcuC family C4-dicarboxylate transporter|nr:C4-dicarboxylate transporter DcuC [Desulfovibrio sp.]
MMIWVGLVILIGTVWCMVKRYESRMVLIVAGFLMASFAGDPMAAFKGFTKGMTESALICNICSVMGFAYAMGFTGCDKHLSVGVSGWLRHVRLFLIPAATLTTFFVNISLPSAAGVSAAVGSVVIPLLISQGITPAMAGSAVMMGTYGSILSPGLPHNPMVAKIAAEVYGRDVNVMEVITRHSTASVASVLVAAFALWMIAIFVTRETKGFEDVNNEYTPPEGFKVNPVYAVIPIIPIVLLMLGASFPQQLPWLSKLRVEHTMLLGAIIALVATRKSPKEATKSFFNGLGKGYADILGIVIAADVFVGGMTSIGLVDAGINLMKSSTNAASLAAALGPFAMAVVCGSGNAATIAFNEAITVHAPQFGMDVITMGAIATLTGCLGRCMSPLSGVGIVCSGLAKVNPMELAKRNAVPAIIGMIVGYSVLMYF